MVKGRNTYSASLAETALGTIRSLEHVIQTLDQKLPEQQKLSDDCQKRVQEFQEKVGQPFEYEEKVLELEKRQDEIVQTLDLNKNQAPNQLETSQTELTIEQNESMSAEKPTRVRARLRRHNHGVKV